MSKGNQKARSTQEALNSIAYSLETLAEIERRRYAIQMQSLAPPPQDSGEEE